MVKIDGQLFSEADICSLIKNINPTKSGDDNKSLQLPNTQFSLSFDDSLRLQNILYQITKLLAPKYIVYIHNYIN